LPDPVIFQRKVNALAAPTHKPLSSKLGSGFFMWYTIFTMNNKKIASNGFVGFIHYLLGGLVIPFVFTLIIGLVIGVIFYFLATSGMALASAKLYITEAFSLVAMWLAVWFTARLLSKNYEIKSVDSVTTIATGIKLVVAIVLSSFSIVAINLARSVTPDIQNIATGSLVVAIVFQVVDILVFYFLSRFYFRKFQGQSAPSVVAASAPITPTEPTNGGFVSK
jgi:hypothetical protein